MKVITFEEIEVGDTIMVLEEANGCVTTATGVVTNKTDYDEIDLNEHLGIGIYEDSLVVLVKAFEPTVESESV